MSENIETPRPDENMTDPYADEKPSPWADVLSPARARKAFSAGTASGVVAGGAVVATAFTDGAVSPEEIALIIGSAVVGFVGGFFAAYFPKNARTS